MSQAAIDGHECLRFGGSGSDFAEEPATRVQSRPRRLRVVPACPPGPLLVGVDQELAIDDVADVALEGAVASRLVLPSSTLRSK